MVTRTSGEAQKRFGQLLDTAQRETVALTRHGRPAAFLISPQEMAELLDSRKRRSKAITELEQWRQLAAKKASPAAGTLTDEKINRMVHDLR